MSNDEERRRLRSEDVDAVLSSIFGETSRTAARYMLEHLYDEAYSAGADRVYSEAHLEGFEEGCRVGHSESYDEGYESGYNDAQ